MAAQKVAPQKSKASEKLGDFEFDANIYREVSYSAELKQISLVSSKFITKAEFFLPDGDEATAKCLFDGTLKDVTIDDDEGTVAGHYDWQAEIKFGRKTGLKLATTYLLIYSGIGGLDRGHVNFYFNKIGRFSTYPYFRAHFSNHAGEAGLMLPPLPSLNERVG
jgi:hypothetical protein